jgi:hypothetical protein
MLQIDLQQVDTYRIDPKDREELHQNRRWRSALEIIVNHEVTAFATDELFNRLISEKWASFGRKMYITRRVLPYLIMLVVLTSVAWLRGSQTHGAWKRQGSDAPNVTASVYCVRDLSDHAASDPGSRDSTSQHGSNTSNTSLSIEPIAAWNKAATETLTLEALLVLAGAPYLLWQGWRLRRPHISDLDTNGDAAVSALELSALLQKTLEKNLAFLLDILGATAIIAAGISRALCREKIELEFLAVACVLLYCNLLNVFIHFKFIGVLVITMYNILLEDFSRFLVAYMTFLLAFTCGMFLLMQRSEGFHDDCDQGDASGTSACLWEPRGEPGYLMLRLLWASFGDSIGVFQALVLAGLV